MKVCITLALIALTGCTPFWNPAGAKAIRYEDFTTLYYQINPERTKAYVFFSDQKLLVVGMSLGTRWDKEAEKYSIGFGGVRNTEANRKKYGSTPIQATRQGDLWMKELDIYVGVHGKPEDKFKMYYVTREGIWGKEIPCRGTILVAGCASDRHKTDAGTEGLAAAQRDIAALKMLLKSKSPDQLIQSFIPTGPQRFGGYDYYYNYGANIAIRAELESRGATARSALEAHRKDKTPIWEAINGPGDTVGRICDELLQKLPKQAVESTRAPEGARGSP